jgi:iron complex transport system permease protein
MKKTDYPGKMSILQILALIVIPIFCGLVCLCLGRMRVPPGEMLRSLFGGDIGAQEASVLWSMRLPRILLAALVGSGLAVSGCVFQSMFSNPLATPDTLGVASGASFGAAVAILFGLQMIGIQVTAFAFGIIAVSLTYLSGWKRSEGRATVILAGIMMSSLFSALVSLVKYVADTESQLPAITYWLMGSLNSASYASLAMGAPVIIGGIVIVCLLRWRINLLPLSEDESRTFGTNIRLLRGVLAVCATAITASCVAMCGQVGWVGLLVPHICRMKFGSNHVLLIPASISIGAAFMILVDTAARSLTAAEIPVSILTAIIGAPFFIVMMRKSRGWSL